MLHGAISRCNQSNALGAIGRILFAGNGRQAIAATIAALVPVGERLGVEALTYPVAKAIAGRVGVTLVPLAIDEHGLVPDAVWTAHRAGPLRAVYLQPTLHNPLGVAMPDRRRAELADILHDRGIYAIEDAVYGFLHDEPPLASLAPDHTVLVESLSKRLAPGLWWELPAPWRADTFVAVAARSGIAVTLAAAFAVGPGHAPNAVRLALGSPPLDVLSAGLEVLAKLAHGVQEDAWVE